MKKVFILISALVSLSCSRSGDNTPCGPFTLQVFNYSDTLSVAIPAGDTTFIILERTANAKQEEIPLPFEIVENASLSDTSRIVLNVSDSTYLSGPERAVSSVDYKGDSVFIWYSHFAKPSGLAKNSSGLQCSPPPQPELNLRNALILSPVGRNVAFIERKR